MHLYVYIYIHTCIHLIYILQGFLQKKGGPKTKTPNSCRFASTSNASELCTSEKFRGSKNPKVPQDVGIVGPLHLPFMAYTWRF